MKYRIRTALYEFFVLSAVIYVYLTFVLSLGN
jgi:hypothetical protein